MARPPRAPAEPAASILLEAFDALDDAVILSDPAGRIVAWNRAAERLYGVTAEEVLGREAVEVVSGLTTDDVAWGDVAPILAEGREWQAELRQRDATGREFVARVTARVIRFDEAGIHTLVTIRDIADQRSVEEERGLLALAVDQSAESVVITDAAATILYVNPAFEAASGYSRDEVIGRNPRILRSGAQGPDFYRAMWAALLAGETFRTEFLNRRKDGTEYQEVSTISPVRDAHGRTTHYVAVKRDVSRQRAFERRIDRESRERLSALEALGSLRSLATAEATAEAIAEQVIGSGAFNQVGLMSFEDEDRAVVLALQHKRGSYDVARVLPSARSKELYQRAQVGAWIEETARTSDFRLRELRRQGIRSLASIPIRHAGELVGVIAAGVGRDDPANLEGRLELLGEIAAVVSALIGPSLLERRATAESRRRIEGVIARGAFTPHFQPVVHLETGAVTGYEVLTRFADRTPPDVVFATAQRCGVGLELEEATIAAALAAADTLPATANININVSPGLVLEGDRLARLLGRWGWKITLEITEHEPIDDYVAVRVALAKLGPSVRLAVDDAGSGFASLRHILELRPDTVKLDRGLVHDLDTDPTRQALVAGMVYFAARTGFKLLAEGVEREAERRALLELGVELGQGWLFGQAAPAPPAATVPGSPIAPLSPSRPRHPIAIRGGSTRLPRTVSPLGVDGTI